MAVILNGYKRTEVGVIPEDWEVASLQDVCTETITYGIVQCGPHIENGIPYIRVSDMNSPTLDVSTMLKTSQAIATRFSRSQVEEGDVVYALRGKIGEVRTVDKFVAGANLTQGTARLAPNDRVISTYLLHSLRSQRTLRQADLAAKGSTFREITLEALRQIELPIPPIPEQRAIAAALSDVDALLVKLDQLIAKKRDLKQATMQQLLTGQTRLPGFSGVWEVKRLGDVSQLMNGFAFKSSTYNEFGRYKVVTIANVQDGFMNTEVCNKVAQLPQDIQSHQCLTQGDILISMTGNVGRVCRVCDDNCLLNQRVGKLIPVGIDGSFLFAILHQPSFLVSMANKAKGGAQGNLSKADITEYELNLPPSKEQTAIATVLSDMDAELAALKTRRDKTRTLKQGMMQELLTGRIRLN